MARLIDATIDELKQLLASKQVSAREVVESHIRHARAHESQVQAFNCLTEDLAYKQAQKIDGLIQSGAELPPLAGVPVAIKDNMCVADYPTTCSSKILANFKPQYFATAIERLFQAGAICIGKTNMDEFAMGSSTENSAFKKTSNPWDESCVPGGSSGGSAAAVSAGFSIVALGSDTGGSIRQPASFCGVVGMKPTYGMVSRFGLVAFASSLDQIGPFGRSVKDVAYTLSAISGHDRRDSTSIANPFEKQEKDMAAALSPRLLEAHAKSLRIGIIKELAGEGIDADVRQAVLEAAHVFEKLGARVEEVSIPNARYALPVYYLIATAEASANLARFDGVRYGLRDAGAEDVLNMYMATRQHGFGAEVKRRIMLGTYALSTGYYDAYYKKAQQVRRLLTEDFDRIFADFDLVLCPTAPSVAFKLDEKTDDPLQMYLSDIATIPANLAGLPAISLPCGHGKNGLPIGLQLIGSHLSDSLLLKTAYVFEQSTDFHKKGSPILEHARC